MYIEDLLATLRCSNVPLTWMLVQGAVFAGLTMLVTARTSTDELLQRAGLHFFMVDLATATRKCSLCLAIMNERLQDDLLTKIESQFEVIATQTHELLGQHLLRRQEALSGAKEQQDQHTRGDLTSSSEPAIAPLDLGDGPIDWTLLEYWEGFEDWDMERSFWDLTTRAETDILAFGDIS